MRLTVRELSIVQIEGSNNVTAKFVEILPSKIFLDSECAIGIDGSTTNSGITIIDTYSGKVKYSISAARSGGETPVQYKVALKKFLTALFMAFKSLSDVYYEEPYFGYVGAAERLMMLRTSVSEIKAEKAPALNYLNYGEINNKRWKKLFLAPQKCPVGTELEKAAVRAKMVALFPCYEVCTEDEVDSAAMVMVAVHSKLQGEDLRSRKKKNKFAYDLTFIGANEDEDALREILEVEGIRHDAMLGGLSMVEIGTHDRFDESIYEYMSDDDKVIVLKFDSETHGNVHLKYKIGHLAATYEYIYAVVWRRYRLKECD